MGEDIMSPIVRAMDASVATAEIESAVDGRISDVIPERVGQRFAGFLDKVNEGLDHLAGSLYVEGIESERGSALITIDGRELNPNAFYNIDIECAPNSDRVGLWLHPESHRKILIEDGYCFGGVRLARYPEIKEVRQGWLRRKRVRKHTGRTIYSWGVARPHTRFSSSSRGKYGDDLEGFREALMSEYAKVVEWEIRDQMPAEEIRSFESMMDILCDLPGTLQRIYDVRQDKARRILDRI